MSDTVPANGKAPSPRTRVRRCVCCSMAFHQWELVYQQTPR
ncbi:hypothetical protein [Paraburkholderia sacchari]|nr:hypothetical protein [Paraburkholderia sacchari]